VRIVLVLYIPVYDFFHIGKDVTKFQLKFNFQVMGKMSLP